MDGHYDILRRAVERVREPDRRQAVYDHARRVLVQQMRAADPPIPDVVIQAEQEALETAIRRVEADVDGGTLHRPAAPAQRPADPRPAAPRPAPPRAEPPRPQPPRSAAPRPEPPRPAAGMDGRVDPRLAAQGPVAQGAVAQRPVAQRPAVQWPAVETPAVQRPAAGPLDVPAGPL